MKGNLPPTEAGRLDTTLERDVIQTCVITCWAYVVRPPLFMKPVVAFLLFLAAVSLVFAQGLNMKRWHGPVIGAKTPPPLSLPNAYAAAMQHVGLATNHLWCVTAKCGEDWGTTNVTHWEFKFSDTNKNITTVLVFFDKSAYHMMGAAVVSDPVR